MNTWETAAVIRLIDHLSGPLEGLSGKVNKHATGMSATLERTSQKMSDAGRSMSLGFTLPIVEAARHLYETQIEFSKIGNTVEGILRNRAVTMKDVAKDFGGGVDQYVESQRKLFESMSAGASAKTNGLTNALEMQKSAMAALKAGLDVPAAAAIAQQSTYAAAAGRIDQHEATEDLIRMSLGSGVKFRDASGKPLPFHEISAAVKDVADLWITTLGNGAHGAKDVFEALKFSLPTAHSLHFDKGLLGVWTEALADRGFIGSEAGVAQRSFLNSLSHLKASAVPTLLSAGVDFNKFVSLDPDRQLTAEAFALAQRRRGMSVLDSAAKKMFAEAQKRADANPETSFLEEIRLGSIGLLKRTNKGKAGTPLPADLAEKYTQQFISNYVEGINLPGLWLAMLNANNGRGLTQGQLGNIFEGRQIPRISSFVTPNQTIDLGMERMYGADWREQLRNGGLHPAYGGASQRQAEEHNKGAEGAVRHIGNAFIDLNKALGDAGAFDGITAGIDSLAAAVRAASAVNPYALKGVAEGLTILAAAGPALWIGGKLISVATGVGKFAGAITGLSVVLAAAEKALPSLLRPSSPAAKVAQKAASPLAVEAAETGGALLASRLAFLRGGAIPLGLLGLSAVKYDLAHGNAGRTWLRNMLGIPDPEGDLAAALPFSTGVMPGVFAFGRQGFKPIGALGPGGYAPVAPASPVPTFAQAAAAHVEGSAELAVTTTSHLELKLDRGLIAGEIRDEVKRTLVSVPLGETMAGSNTGAKPWGTMTGLRAGRSDF